MVAGPGGETRGTFVDSVRMLLNNNAESDVFNGMNTTICVVATNARLEKTKLYFQRGGRISNLRRN
ncbi:MAG: hypothetical protein BECKG1743F_GA0114225_106933 [Candidatus Kentron sp. G]|nr:MAG: hypothetical protein BECKG1743F_GA0114225_106933 [Candidatus Kentron sp. G]VFN04135.1 MAG: hypothetical protein BECKG1743E_GA0114224_106964 [Candidatus Kentron sp. G]